MKRRDIFAAIAGLFSLPMAAKASAKAKAKPIIIRDIHGRLISVSGNPEACREVIAAERASVDLDAIRAGIKTRHRMLAERGYEPVAVLANGREYCGYYLPAGHAERPRRGTPIGDGYAV